ncbi:MAG: hypothetical protein ACK5W9_03060, partial [Bdellovibrionales bacterium]
PHYMANSSGVKINSRPEDWDEASEQLKSIFIEVQAGIIQIVKSFKNHSNALEVEDILKRIETLSLIDHASEYKKESSFVRDGCDKPNAYYSAYNHKITFCPQVLNWPKATLEMIMSHEIAHSFDPCAMSRILIKQSEFRLLGLRETFLSNGFPKNTTFSNRIQQKRSPFYNINQCLSAPDSAHAPVPSIIDIVRATEVSYGNTTPIHAMAIEALLEKEKITYEKRGHAIKKHYAELKYCTEFSGYSYLAEAFSDWISSQYI